MHFLAVVVESSIRVVQFVASVVPTLVLLLEPIFLLFAYMSMHHTLGGRFVRLIILHMLPRRKFIKIVFFLF